MSSETKKSILSKATHLFSEQGYDSVGVNEIVLQCGITKPTLYYYFGSKENLLKAIITDNGETLRTKLHERCAAQTDFEKKLVSVADEYLRFTSENREFFRLYLSLIFTPPSNKAFKIAKLEAEAIQAFIETIFDGETNYRDKKSFFTATFIGQVNMFSTLILNNYISYSKTYAETLITMYLNGARSIAK